MATTVDARGLSCPQPVILALDEIKRGKDKDIIVLVDTNTSKENVMRAAISQGCRINEVTPEVEGYRIQIMKN
jgi:tRNA 2-thiouridine synthesizing protein A